MKLLLKAAGKYSCKHGSYRENAFSPV